MEISAVAADVVPHYASRIAFIDVLTDDPAAKNVLDRYPGQYIPTSVFIGADGEVADTHIGPLTEGGMRERLDELAGAAE